MSEKQFERWNDHSCKVKDNQENTFLNWEDVVKKLNEQQATIEALKRENDKLYHWKSNDTLKEPVTYEAKEKVMIKLDKGVPL